MIYKNVNTKQEYEITHDYSLPPCSSPIRNMVSIRCVTQKPPITLTEANIIAKQANHSAASDGESLNETSTIAPITMTPLTGTEKQNKNKNNVKITM